MNPCFYSATMGWLFTYYFWLNVEPEVRWPAACLLVPRILWKSGENGLWSVY